MTAYPWNLSQILDGRPTVGGLMDLCEENYRVMLRLAPALRELRGRHRSRPREGLDLHLVVIEQTRYSSLVHLTYYFGRGGHHAPEPDAVLRVYHDARQAEVLHLRQSLFTLCQGFRSPALEQKWRLNLFLSKWLGYCLNQGHAFRPIQDLAGAGEGIAIELH